jgi:hypothetical protein
MMRILVVVAILLCGGFAALTPTQNSLLAELCSTTNIVTATSGSWCNGNTDSCTYQGVLCNGDGTVALSLALTGLIGSWPAGFFAGLPISELILVGDISLSGPIVLPSTTTVVQILADVVVDLDPRRLYKLSKLQHFQCSAAALGHTYLPHKLGGAAQPDLNIVIFQQCDMSGEIPADMFAVDTAPMNTLTLSSNALTGSVPASVCALELQTFDISNNQISNVTCVNTMTVTASCDLRNNPLCALTTNSLCQQSTPLTGVFDVCGVCDGDASTCTDCAGVVLGTSKYDDCGVCNGNGHTCADCAGVYHGTSRRDRCGVCNGDGGECGIPGLQHVLHAFGFWLWAFIILLLLICIVGGIMCALAVCRSNRVDVRRPKNVRLPVVNNL